MFFPITGETVCREIVKLVITLIVIWSIAKAIFPEIFPLNFGEEKNISMMISKLSYKLDIMCRQGGVQQDPIKALESGVHFRKYISKSYPLVCSSLGLGKNWDEAVGKILNIHYNEDVINVVNL